MKITPTLLTDGYKIDHRRQYIEGTKSVYANMTPRKSRIEGINEVVVFGVQYYILSTLIDIWNKEFFERDINEITKEFMEEMTEYTLSEKSANDIGIEHWKALHKLGYMPLIIKALPEGTRCPIKVPVYTVKETHPDFYWLTNFIETDMSAETWGLMTSATISNQYYKIFSKWAMKTVGNTDFVKFQGHNFSYRGMLGREAAAIVDLGHMAGGFVGSDTLHGRKYAKKFYKAKQDGFNNIISCSVFATEHAVMCVSTGFYILKNKLTWERYGDAELAVFKRLITELYPSGIVSVVSDTWNLWKVLTEYLPMLKKEILARDGKLVIRPDSGDPVDIVCGKKWDDVQNPHDYYSNAIEKGVVECLWDIFGGTKSEEGYKILDSHIGCIYGDSITPTRAENICQRLADKNFASINWVAGIGSYTYQYVTRDTFGFAQKATYAEVEIDGVIHGIEVFKDPITDDGTKKSAKGLLCVMEDDQNNIVCYDQCTKEQENQGMLKTVFLNGNLVSETTLEKVRTKTTNLTKQKLEA